MKTFNLAKIATAVALIGAHQAHADTFSYVELPTPTDQVRHLYPIAVNDSGLAVVQGILPENLPIDLNRLSIGTRNFIGIPSDVEDLDTYELSYAQYTALVNALRDPDNQLPDNLRISYYFAGSYDGQAVSLYSPLDDTDPATPEYANSTDHYFYGANNNNIRVGTATAPYREFTHQYFASADATEASEITYSERDFTRRGLWYDGTQYTLIAPPETAVLGGESVLTDINETNLAVGFASVALSPESVTALAECEENALEETEINPVNICMWRRWHALQRAEADNISFNLDIPAERSIYDMRAMRWQLDANGQVISAEPLGTLLERGEEDLNDYSSYAYAVNNNGIAVGQSWTYYDGDIGNVSRRIKMPAIFINDEVRAVTDSPDYVWGSATDINDNNVVTGFLIKTVQGLQRYVGFTYDIETEQLTELPGFFNGSSTIPRAINDAGLIVGSGEIEPNLSTQRRRVGFLYDLENPEQGFINLNDAVSCESPYFIVSADSVNEQGQLLSTAIIEGSYTDANGEEQVEQLVRTLQMSPVNGELNDCDVVDQKVERQGAAVSPWGALGILLISVLITIRRKITS
ncbi:DUF3466 family protein [Pseudidiomarina taiwanensis]|uniref:DUF3466 domain-containing protein n=1 Tax=Pseudidiomarina taiwanensis TaxID=337250 RepID=A0A432ZND0_9GAMM|nr:DUF3466 family protein [Pseudidiomarina taiwanensis]RUO79362.1 hypothetical protein CWI83_02315 [Pseudidiomarina taiwanensis]